MKSVQEPAGAGKWEVLRRLRYGDVLKLIRSRYGANPPDDDAARPDVMELLFLASMAPTTRPQSRTEAQAGRSHEG